MKAMTDRVELLKKILPYVGRYKGQWFLLVLLKVGQKVPFIIQPLLFKMLIDNVIAKKNLSFMLPLVLMYTGLYLLETIFKVGHRVVDNNLFNRITQELRNDIWNQYAEMPWRIYQSFPLSDMVRRLIQDVDMVKFFIIGEVFDYLASVISIIFSFMIMGFLSWPMVIVALVLWGVSLLHIGGLGEGLHLKLLELLGEEERNIITEMEERIQRISFDWHEVKANGLEEAEHIRLKAVLNKLLLNKQETEKVFFKRNMILDFKSKVIDSLGMYVVGGLLYMGVGLEIGAIIACINYYQNILQDYHCAMEIDANLGWVKPSIMRIIEILESELSKEDTPFGMSKIHNTATANAPNELIYEINIDNYRYGEREEVFGKVEIIIKKGDKLLLDGMSGSGKSTLMKLMAGELPIEDKKIFLYGICINQLTESETYRYLRKLDNEQYMMNITVREYLQIAKEDADDEEMRQACIATGLWSDLQKISPDLQLSVGENGTNLSGGQKQKLALTRIFLAEDKILLLDEAFSAIDRKDMIMIMEHLLERYRDGTIVMIAHDDAIKSKFDRIHFL